MLTGGSVRAAEPYGGVVSAGRGPRPSRTLISLQLSRTPVPATYTIDIRFGFGTADRNGQCADRTL